MILLFLCVKLTHFYTVCVGSIAELEKLTGTKVTDLHRESIDHLVIQGKTGPLRRIDEVSEYFVFVFFFLEKKRRNVR